MSKEMIILLCLFPVILGGMAWFYEGRLQKQQTEFQSQLRQMLPQQTRKQGKQVDPYIANQVKNTIIKHLREVQVCYNTYTDKGPEVKDGNLKLDWRINEDGKTVQPEIVSSPFKDSAFHGCVTGAVKS